MIFAIGLLRRRDLRTTEQPFVSIVVAARDEQAFITACVESLIDQTYPRNQYEVLVVDDDSSDDTRAILESYADEVCVLSPLPEFAGYAAKKRPMASGLARARGEIILTTDADCTVPPTWVKTMVEHFTPETSVVAGYSRIAPVSSGIVHRFQTFDFHALLSAAAGAIGVGRSWAATGQNFAFRRSIFDLVGGYESIANRPSGDDVLLLQRFRKARATTAFCSDPAGHATTWRSESLSGLVNQRRRWASNAIVQIGLNPAFFAYVSGVLSANLVPLFAADTRFGGAAISLWMAKLLLDFVVLWLSRRRLGTSPSLWFYPVWQILQIPYTLLVGVAGTFLGFTWKGRRHTRVSPPSSRYSPKDEPEASHVTM